MGVANSALADLIAVTLDDLPEQYFEVGWDDHRYEFCRIYQSERMEVDGGEQITRVLMLDHTGNARYRTLYDTDQPNVQDVITTIRVPWVQIGTNYSWDKLEILRNKNNAKGFVKLLKLRRTDGLWSLANLIEERAWKTPTNSGDDLYPYGVPYYINMLTKGSTTAGFNGQTIRYQDGSTDTTCAGVDASTAANAKWRNYAFTYSTIDNALLRSFRLAFMYSKFKAPILVSDAAQKRNAAKRIYTDFGNTADLMDLADAKDDNHQGKEVLGNLRVQDDGLVLLNRLPVVPIDELEAVTDPEQGTATKPIYCVNFEKFIPYVQEGYWNEESEPMTDRGQHTTFTVFLDGSHNNLCTNRREAGFVGHLPIAA